MPERSSGSLPTAPYRHTQVGYTTIIALGIAVLVAIRLVVATTRPALVVGAGIVVLALLLFSSLTVVVQDGMAEVFFGPGLIRRRIPLSRVREVRAVRNRWYYGWGIRLTPHGWLWNVSGLGGVELEFNDGGKFRIGSDEPEVLAEVIRRHAAS